MLLGGCPGGFSSAVAILAFLVAYYLLSIEVYLPRTCSDASTVFWRLGDRAQDPARSWNAGFLGPDVTAFGYRCAVRSRRLDWCRIVLVTATLAAIRNTRELYRAEHYRERL